MKTTSILINENGIVMASVEEKPKPLTRINLNFLEPKQLTYETDRL